MERRAEALLGVADAEEVPAGPTSRMASTASVSSSTTIGSSNAATIAEQVGVEHELGGRGVQPALHPSGAVHQEVDAAHHGAPQREHALVGGLGVEGVGGDTFDERYGTP